MRITTNISNSHLYDLQAMIGAGCNRLLIISPFLANDLKKLLSKFNFESVKRVELITTFKENNPEQLTKPQQLYDFIEYFNIHFPEIKVKVHVDNHLHGKIYVSTTDNTHEAIITSANFTNNGLIHNHEWGVLSSKTEQIEALISEAFGGIEYSEVTLTQLRKAIKFAEFYKESNAWNINQPTANIDILSQVYSSDSDSEKEPLYFLKPIGTSYDPIVLDERRDFSDLHQNLHFSKKKPKGVSKGDVVITSGVGCNSLLSHFKVTGTLSHVTDEEKERDSWKERWPWYMEGQSQSTNFGLDWWKYNITLKLVLADFTLLYPDVPITSAGSFTLGTLNFGADKVHITKEFGEYLIKRINECV